MKAQRRKQILLDEAHQRLETRKEFLVAKNLPNNDFRKSSKAADFQQENRLRDREKTGAENNSNHLGTGKPFSSVQATESHKNALLKTNEISPAPGFSRSPIQPRRRTDTLDPAGDAVAA
jgi:hypothetical protein